MVRLTYSYGLWMLFRIEPTLSATCQCRKISQSNRRGGMTPKGELRLIVMLLLCLKKAVPADKHFLQSFAEYHGFGMVTVLSCSETREDEGTLKMVRRLSKIMYVSYVRGGSVRGHEQREVGHLIDFVQSRENIYAHGCVNFVPDVP